MHRSCVEDGLGLAVNYRCVLFARLGVGAIENLEGHDEVSPETSALQLEDVELAKPFLIWHVTETSR